jgi:hypothetical protein
VYSQFTRSEEVSATDPPMELFAVPVWQLDWLQVCSPGEPVAPAFPLSDSMPAKNNIPAVPNVKVK